MPITDYLHLKALLHGRNATQSIIWTRHYTTLGISGDSGLLNIIVPISVGIFFGGLRKLYLGGGSLLGPQHFATRINFSAPLPSCAKQVNLFRVGHVAIHQPMMQIRREM
jgi:hypothetical protein